MSALPSTMSENNLTEVAGGFPALNGNDIFVLNRNQHSYRYELNKRLKSKQSQLVKISKEDCKCTKIIGHLEAVKWPLYPRQYKPSPGYLSLGDWTADPHIWMHYVESQDGILADDDVLLSTDTRYWSIHDVQRYYLGALHCEQVLFTFQYPNLRMPSHLGTYFWKNNTATKRSPHLYTKQFKVSMEITLKKMEAKQTQMSRMIISDQLIKLEQLDYFRRKSFIRRLLSVLSFQDKLQLVSFENLRSSRLEGVRLIQQLACFNAHSLKYLFLWRFVLPNENPLLINYSYITGSGQYIPRPDTKQCFLRSIASLRNLRVLAIEYSHIADGTGSVLLSLLPVIKRPHFRLQLVCREEQTPGLVDAALGVGGFGIPDQAWKIVNTACPDLYLHMAFVCIRDYDAVRRFLVPSLPLRDAHLQLGVDLDIKQRQDSDISCFVRHVAYRYGSTLVSLSIHQWRSALFPLRRVFELMPRLVHFQYLGLVQDDVDLRRMLLIVSTGVCDKLKLLNIQIQDEHSKKEYWRLVVDSITAEYEDIMKLFDIVFCISLYKS